MSTPTAIEGRKTIWKYPLRQQHGYNLIDIPMDAEILAFKEQRGIPTIWALVDTSKIKETRMFRLCTTDETIDCEEGRYIDTVVLDNGAYVVHLFEYDPPNTAQATANAYLREAKASRKVAA